MIFETISHMADTNETAAGTTRLDGITVSNRLYKQVIICTNFTLFNLNALSYYRTRTGKSSLL